MMISSTLPRHCACLLRSSALPAFSTRSVVLRSIGRSAQCRAASSNSSSSSSGAEDSGSSYDYDLFTIGGGSGGSRAARMTASHGKKVALCELPLDFVSSDTGGGVGGTCVLRGCVPKKLMVYASEFADNFNDSVGFGWEERGRPGHNWAAFMEAKRKELLRLNQTYKDQLNGAKVDIIEGRGQVVDPHTVEVNGKRYSARDILISTGSFSVKPPIPGSELCITSDQILDLKERPNKLTIIGGGYIAAEFAGIFCRFGTEVHLIYRQKLMLQRFDEELRHFASEQYQVTGQHLHPSCSPTRFTKQDDGRITVFYKRMEEGAKEEESRDNDCVLLATGRSPRTKGLGLEEAGVELGKKGEVVVDEFSRTRVPSIWALGDCIAKIPLTPVAIMEGMALSTTLGLGKPTKPDYTNVPSAVFSHPNLATVGMTEEEAVIKLGDVDVYSTTFRGMRNTVSGSELKNLMKLVVDPKTDRVVGAHMLGEDAADIVQGFAVSIKAGVTKAVLDSTVGIHPTSAEEFVTIRTPSRKIRASEADKKEAQQAQKQ